jgi:hypothetical protein
VSNPLGSITSTVARLIVLLPPVITVQPQNQAVPRDSNVTFTVEATGTAPLTFQWRFNGVSLPGATNSTLVLSNLQMSNQGTYTVLVSNSVASTTSADAVLTVLSPPSFSSQPQSQTVIAGTNLLLSVTASGTPPLRFQWRLNGSNILGSTSATLLINNTQPINDGDYTVVLTNNYGAITSSIAHVVVNYSLILTVAGGGTITVNPNQQSFAPNTRIDVTAHAALGYGFVDWTGSVNDTDETVTLTMDTNKTLRANFVSYALTINASAGGSVTRAPNQAGFPPNSTVTLTAVPASYFGFIGWTGATNTTNNPIILRMNGDKIVAATFATYTLDVA